VKPTIRLYNRQRGHRPDLAWLRRVIRRALPACLAALKSAEAPLATLEEIEITLIDDPEIGRVHADFLGDPEPTDVITFQHGEILISADTAVRQAAEHGETADRELALYAVHGLLHLAGWEDHDPGEAAAMAGRQAIILAAAVEGVKNG
jgi:probable rRNA maturation factor